MLLLALTLRGEFTDSQHSILRALHHAKEHPMLPAFEIALRAARLFERGLHLKMAWASERRVSDIPVPVRVSTARKLPDHRVGKEEHWWVCARHIAERKNSLAPRHWLAI